MHSILFVVLCSLSLALAAAAQQPRSPNLDEQRAAMRKLSFLIGKWSGEARLLRGPSQWADLAQTEDAQYRLDGLLLVIEGIGISKTDGKAVLQALGIISYDDATSTYRMRAFNDGRYAETDVKLLEGGKGLTWGFASGSYKTSTVLRITDAGDWTELGEITVGSGTPVKFLELKVHRAK
jgi:hypothetical protein